MDFFRNLKKKVEALAYGKSAERVAEKHLRANGYRIIETNYRCREGEIDIVAREGDCLIFCEVKARRTKNYGNALEGVTPQKIKKIRKAADDYIHRKKLQGVDCRFDIVTIDASEGGAKVALIKNAF